MTQTNEEKKVAKAIYDKEYKKICNMIKGDYLSSEETLAAVNAVLYLRGKF